MIGIKGLVMNLRIFWLLITFLILAGCEKGKDIRMAEIKTLTYEVKGDSLLLRGEIISLGDGKIIQYGFLLDDTTQPNVFNARKIVCHDIPKADTFSVLIRNNLSPDSTFYLRTFIETSLDYIYGNELTFNGTGKHRASITGFTPNQGIAGDYVKILGENFGFNSTEIKVFFGTAKAELISFSDRNLTVKVPTYEFSSYCSLKVITNSDTVVAHEQFFLYGPQIIGFSPMTALDEVTLLIEGENFSEDYWQNKVFVGSAQAEVIESSNTQIKALLNTNLILPGAYFITVQSLELKAISSEMFDVETRWKQINPCPEAGMLWARNFVIGSKIYVCAGQTINSEQLTPKI